MGFPDSSVGKESACNAGDSSSIPELGRSAGEEIGYPLQYSWASLVAQLIKNPPAMWETWVQSLGWEDTLGEGKGYALQCSGLENSVDCIVHGVAESQTRLSDFHLTSQEVNLRLAATCNGPSSPSQCVDFLPLEFFYVRGENLVFQNCSSQTLVSLSLSLFCFGHTL